MLSPIDRFLNGITMYRLVLYVLMGLAAISIVFGFAHLINYSGLGMIESLVLLFMVTYGVNELIGKLFGIPTNPESAPITALILFFVLSPVDSLTTAGYLALAGIIAMASKYIFAIRKQHIFNPVAVAAVVVGIPTGIALWWVGTPYLFPFVLVAAILIARKVRRMEMVSITVAAATLMTIFVSVLHHESVISNLTSFFLSGPIIFFAAVMVTEPFTAPGTKKARLVYGGIIGALSNFPLALGVFNTTPELTLALANLVSFFTGMQRRLVLTLTKSETVARDTYQFSFATPTPVSFKAGQYLEWMLPHAKMDMRGLRRYFTIASAPTESDIQIGVKITAGGSTYKEHLAKMVPGQKMYAEMRGGDFILPGNPQEKLAFIAGGIGVTPFRSMIKHLLDAGEKRDVALFYACRTAADIAYRPLFDEATAVGVTTTYILSDETTETPNPGNIEHGMIDEAMLSRRLPDYKDRTFFLSGPDAMVQAYKKLLASLGVSKARIHTDYFPGF